jgi:serine/threonine protein phosphatase PrpC
MIARSKEQTWGFNAPYQLGTASEFRPHHANTRSFTALAGDILILGTDGLFDNLSDRDILGMTFNNNNNDNNNDDDNHNNYISIIINEILMIYSNYTHIC